MRVSVEHRAHGIAQERLLQPAGAKERIDLDRLALDGGSNRRVVHEDDGMPHTQPREGRLELERFVQRLMDEALDSLLAPGRQRVPPESAAEAPHPREADAAHLARIPAQHIHANITQNPAHFILLATFKVMVAEHRDHRYLDEAGDLLGQHTGFLRQTVVRQITTDRDDVRGR